MAINHCQLDAKEPQAASPNVQMYTTRFCPYCIAARDLLSVKGVDYTDIAVDSQPELREKMMRLSGASTVPQIWINETHVGGYTELAVLERGGELDLLLA